MKLRNVLAVMMVAVLMASASVSLAGKKKGGCGKCSKAKAAAVAAEKCDGKCAKEGKDKCDGKCAKAKAAKKAEGGCGKSKCGK